MLEGFPPAGASISDVSAHGLDEFIIVGTGDSGTPECPEATEARLWSSVDGRQWSIVLTDEVENAAAELLPEGGRGWPVVGQTGSYGCPGDGLAHWFPTDKSDWYRMEVEGLHEDSLVDLVAVGEGYVATGHYGDDSDHLGVWVGTVDVFPGARWHRAADPPPQESGHRVLTALAAAGDTVVGFDGSRKPGWYSLDAGETWSNTGFRPGYSVRVMDTLATQQGYLAVGRACCTRPRDAVGVVLTSADGTTWTPAGAEPAFAFPIETIVTTSRGLVAIGEETYVSADGVSWRLAPPLPGYQPEDADIRDVTSPYRLSAAAVGDAIVVVSPYRVWVASATDLDPGSWQQAAPEAPMPSVGDVFSYDLFTHCGPNGALRFGFRQWVPDSDSLVDGDFPPSFDDLEQGVLTFAATNRLEFTGQNGEVVRYLPTDNPPESFACA